jgi:hypothetical protein
MADYHVANGNKSNGAKTKRGRLSILTANVSCGERCWSPVLPAIEREEDRQAPLVAVNSSLKPGSYLEEQLAYQAALSLQQWDRLHRYERAQTAYMMKQALDDPFGETDSARILMETGVSALKAQLSSVAGFIELLQILPIADPAKRIQPADGRLLLLNAAAYCARGVPTEQPFAEPPEWTWGVVIEGLSELAADCGKSIDRLLKSLREWAIAEHERLSSTLREVRPYLNARLFIRGANLSTSTTPRFSGGSSRS